MYKSHLFICSSCKYQEEGATVEGIGNQLKKDIKKKVKELMPNDKSIRVSTSGCMGKCKSGVAAVIYPESKWFLDLRPEDEHRVIDELIKSHQCN